ncbi:MAG: DUF1064 domain-containing protein [Lysobacter sp.]
MSSGKRSLRFSSESDMPPGMLKLYRESQAGIPLPKAPVPLATTPAEPTEPKRSKYGAVVTHVDGIRFDSKREAKYYEQLKLRKAAGEVIYFLRQVPIHLPGGTKLVIDFLEVHADGSLHYVDAKGRETPAFRIKQREVHHHYPFRIELV